MKLSILDQSIAIAGRPHSASIRETLDLAAKRLRENCTLRELLDAIPSPAIVLNSKRQTIAANLALRKMFDVAMGESRSIMGRRRAIVAEFDRLEPLDGPGQPRLQWHGRRPAELLLGQPDVRTAALGIVGGERLVDDPALGTG